MDSKASTSNGKTTKRINAEIPVETHRLVKAAFARKGKSITTGIRECLEEVAAKEK